MSARERAGIAAILVLGVALRLHGLSTFPMEQDEMYTIVESRDLFHTKIMPGIAARPFYYLLQHPFLSLPNTPVMLRLMPLLFGIVGILVMWRLGRRAVGVTAGLVAALLTAISPWHIYVSGMARYWALVFLLAATAYLLMLRAYESDRVRDYLAALIVLTIGTATHPSFSLPMAGAILGLSLVNDGAGWRIRWPTANGWRWLWLPFGVLVLCAVVALKVTGKQSAIHNWGGRGTAAVLRLAPAMVEWMTVSVAAAACVGVVLLWASGTAAHRRWALMTLLGATTSVTLMIVSALSTNIYADYGLPMLPLLFVAAAAIPDQLMRVGAHCARLATLATVLIVAPILPSTLSHLSDGTRFDYRPAYRRIEQDDPSALVLTTPLIEQLTYGPGLRTLELTADTTVLREALARERTMWAVLSIKRTGLVGDDAGTLQPWVERNCRRVQVTERPRWDYRFYRVELYRCQAGA